MRTLALPLIAFAFLSPIATPAPAQGTPKTATAQQAARPSVLLVTVDTLRPDALGFVTGRNETPAIDALAKDGFRFLQAISQVPITLPSHTSIFSGLIPPRHGVRDNGQMVPGSIPLLADVLRAQGYATAAFVSGYPLEARFGLDRGFQHYDDALPVKNVERRAEATTTAALKALPTLPQPFFLWIHYYDPHDPYEPPRVYWQAGPRGGYDGEVSYTDHWIGRLREGAQAAAPGGLLSVLTADHGEGLGEHEEMTHGYFIYDSTMVVPLVVHWPGQVAAGESRNAVRLVDVAPTVLELLGLPPWPDVDGVSLAPTLRGRPQQVPAAYLETHLPWRFFGWAPLEGLRRDGWKLIVAPKPELYDLAADPGERANRYDADRRRAAELVAAFRQVKALPARASKSSEDPEVTEKLRALGYVGAGSSASGAIPSGLPDPKEKIAERKLLIEAEALRLGGRLQEALAVFEQVLAKEPNDRFATLRSGTLLFQLGRNAEALPRLERAVKADPDRAEARYALADVLTQSGQAERATAQWMEVVRLQPRRPEAWVNLAITLLGAGKREEAAKAVAQALAVDPTQRERLEKDPKIAPLLPPR
jgi:choline-sulfatase